MKPLYKVVLLNIVIAIVLITVYFITAFLLGYGANSSYAEASTRLYIVFGCGHLLLNIWLLYKFGALNLINVGFTIIELLSLYAAVFFYFSGYL